MHGRPYRIVIPESARAGITFDGNKPCMKSLAMVVGPRILWLLLTEGHGVPGEKVPRIIDGLRPEVTLSDGPKGAKYRVVHVSYQNPHNPRTRINAGFKYTPLEQGSLDGTIHPLPPSV